MHLTPAQLIKANELQQEYFTLTQHITELQQLIHDLLQNKCELNVSFAIHNTDQCQANKATATADPMEEVRMFFMGMRQQAAQKPCRTTGSFTATESTGIRILNACLQEKQEHRNLVQQQIEAILIPSMKIELTELITNPIQDLHHGNHNSSHQ